ncbi:cytochrome c biogenesis protein ResB [Bacillus chungangensis]|uniref:Cytochrome c biogenesis protein n=1 Tax=Bacillus chungangensis TaxID=587633 RepID=A0ABT9WX27_9BACI|nr:cytochrome c biogenesis protein ResB [Bacillus chungangensis]MDQ0177851.1 cytochrome c biogenesis protein [Bacillus chungangensis]
MKQMIKCECGHVNPHGTILCESCGKALTEEAKKETLHDMRYEGTARRSQTYNRTIIDKIWSFFSSVKVGVWLIVITLIASALGTVLPQEMYVPGATPAEIADYYETQYGWFGKLYYQLGFNDLYDLLWYKLLVASIGVSLVICSLDRFVPLYRALKNQRVTRNEGFLKRQRLYSYTETVQADAIFAQAKEKLQVKRYRIREENGNILAEKGRFSRWGPYVNHIGLIIFLIGILLRSVPGMYVDELLWIREGEKKVIPGTNGEYMLENKKFIVEVYDKETDKEVFGEAIDRVGVIEKNFQTDAILYKRTDDGLPGEDKFDQEREVEIRVNEPLKFDHFAVYQMSYKLNEIEAMTFDLVKKQTEESFGTVTIDLFNPQDEYDLGNGRKVELMGLYPDFSGFASNGEPQTASPVPNNPAFLFKMTSPEHPDGEVSFVAIQQTVEPLGDTEYKMTFKGVDTRNVSSLTIRKDLTLWLLGIGGFIFMFGVVQGAYWNHRRIWLQRNQDGILLAAHTNKNWYGLKRELEFMMKDTDLQAPVDQQELKKRKEKGDQVGN